MWAKWGIKGNREAVGWPSKSRVAGREADNGDSEADWRMVDRECD